MEDSHAVWIILPLLAIFIVIIISIISNHSNKLKTFRSELDLELVKKDGILKDKDLELEKMLADAKGIAQDFATKQFAEWKEKELETHRKVIIQAALDQAKTMLSRWIIENEERIRKDAANRSVRNVLGKVTEHLIPFSEAFSQFNPKDARFLGTPIDLIVFDGIEEKKDEVSIYFVEVKTGTSALSQRQKKVMDAVKNKRVEWLRISIKDFGEDVNELLLPPPA